MPVPAAVTLSRQELYDRVWAEPVQRVAAVLGISDVALAKACRRHQIPVPSRGYWRRKETGHRVRQVKLPALDQASKVSRTITFWPSAHRASAVAEEPAATVHPLLAFERAAENTIVVPEEVRPTHRLIRATRAYWAALKRGDVSLATNEMPRLDIQVSVAARPRALRILQVLLENLDARGFEPTATADGHTRVKVLGVTLDLAVREQHRQVPHVPTPKEVADQKKHSWMTPPRVDTVATGDLEFRLENTWGTRHLWRDGKRQRLEQLLNDVIEGMVLAALKELERRDERERQRRAQQEAEEHRQAEERRQLEESARVTHLDSLLAATERHERLQQFVRRLRAIVGTRPELDDWFKWAETYIDQRDPLRAWREPSATIDLYHPAHGYEADTVISNGFKDGLSGDTDSARRPPSVLVADVPISFGYSSTCVKVSLPEVAILPFEELPREHNFRCFRAPAALLNRFPRSLQ